MTVQPARSYLVIVLAIVIAGVLISASLFVALGEGSRTTTITSTETSTSMSTKTVTTTSIPPTSATTSTSSAQASVSLNTVASIPIANPSQSVIRIALDASNGYLYVTNGTSSPSITVVDLSNNSIIANIPLANATGGLLYDPSNGYVYVSQSCLEVIDYGTKSNQTDLSTGVTAVVINGTQVVTEISGPCASGGLTYDPSDHHIFEASNSNPNGIVNVIDDRNSTVVATIPVGGPTGNPTGIAYDAANGMVYVGDLSSGSVDVISAATNSVVATIKVESGSPVYALDAVVYNPLNRLIYVTNGITYDYNTEINGTMVVGNFTLPCSGGTGSELDGFTFDSARGIMFMSACGTVVASNGSTSAVLASTNVPGASSLAYDPSNYDLYAVANAGIVVISTTDG